jgi:hypothetical protein
LRRASGDENAINSGEAYALTYLGGATLVSPFDGATAFGGTTLLQTVRVTSNSSAHTFTYGANSLSNSGELTKVALPYGGELRWTYETFTYAGQIAYRQVMQRDRPELYVLGNGERRADCDGAGQHQERDRGVHV